MQSKTTLSDVKLNSTTVSAFNSDTGNPSFTYKNPNGQKFYWQLYYGSTQLKKSGDITTSGTNTISAALTTAERNTLYNQCKTSNSLTNLKFRITTYNSTNGTSSSYYETNTFTMNVVNSDPVWNNKFTIVDINETTKALTDSDYKFIYGYSKLRLTIPASAAESKNPTGNMKNYVISIAGTDTTKTYSTSAITHDAGVINNNSIYVTAYDNRGNKKKLDRTEIANVGNFISYSKPTISSVAGDRTNGMGTTGKFSMTATFWESTFGSVTNKSKLVIKYRTKPNGGSWSGYTTLTTSQYSTNGSGKITISNLTMGTTFTFGTEYTVEVNLADALTSNVTKQFTINSGTVLYSAVKGKGFCFGGLYNSTNGGPLQMAGYKVPGFKVESSWT